MRHCFYRPRTDHNFAIQIVLIQHSGRSKHAWAFTETVKKISKITYTACRFSLFRPVASIKWLGGLSEWPTLTLPPPASVSRLKHTSWYTSDHFICLQYLLFLSLIFRLCWLWRNRELVWDIVRGKFAKQLLSGCSLIRIVSSTTQGSVSLVHGFTHDKTVPCLFSTCLDFFFGGCCEDIERLSI